MLLVRLLVKEVGKSSLKKLHGATGMVDLMNTQMLHPRAEQTSNL